MIPVPSLGGAGVIVWKRGKTDDTTSVYAHYLPASDCLDEFQ
nr:MAG TPA: hypothetical protein [Caudoviricetes sp.]